MIHFPLKNLILIFGICIFSPNCRSFIETRRDPNLQKVDKTLLPNSELKAETRFELESSDPFDKLITNDFRRAMAYKLLYACASMDAFDQVEIAIPETNLGPLKAARTSEPIKDLNTSVIARYTIKRTEQGNFLWEFFSSLTLFIVPYRAIEEYNVKIKATVKHPKGTYDLEVNKVSKQTAWFSIIYFFHMFSSENVLKVSDQIAYEAIDDATRELVKQATKLR
jgi:hypothetical protein